ncbi:MAG: S8 family serine peptidase [Alphaproteobacteria bacterium]|nr:S8 family serine peptidase [Alphaproteobacteria bacterium]
MRLLPGSAAITFPTTLDTDLSAPLDNVGPGPAALFALTQPAAILAGTTGTANPVGTTGDRAVLANFARSTFGLSGAGITIGILSDSFNIRGGYAADVASGALPAGVTVLADGPAGSGDEGRAMAQLIHQIAPDADLMFYTAFRSSADFATGIRALAAAGANIIVDDVTYLDEPFFQQGGGISLAVADVVAQGVDYFSSAGNQGKTFYESLFNGISAPLPGLNGSYQSMNFGTADHPAPTQSLTIATGAAITIDLQWDQPFRSIGTGHAAANSLGLVLYDDRNKIVASAVANRTNGDPVQVLRFTNSTGGTSFHLGIITNGGAVAPHVFKYIVFGSGVTINDPNAGKGSGTVIGHALTDGANAVGAIAAVNAPSLGGNGVAEAFSAYGTGVFMFDAAGNRIAAPRTANKVDFLAPDGVATSVFSTFYGTSAAAPQAAAVAALMLQAAPNLSPARVTAILEQTTVALPGTVKQVGAGLIQATAAIQQALSSRVTTAAAVTPQSFGTAIPGAASPSWITVEASDTQPVTAVLNAINAIASDPTAAGDFSVAIISASDIADHSMTGGTAFAYTNNAFGTVAIIPDWQQSYTN